MRRASALHLDQHAGAVVADEARQAEGDGVAVDERPEARPPGRCR